MLDHEELRKAGSVAFHELKKIPFYTLEVKDDLTTINLFGDAYRFFIDKAKKRLWVKSNHHHKTQSSFKLLVSHKDWTGVFSYPRQKCDSIIRANTKINNECLSNAEFKTFLKSVATVTNQVYGFNKNKMARIFGGILWKHLDLEIAKLAVKVFGLSASSLDYTLIWNNKEEFLDTLRKAPSILPVWRNIILRNVYTEQEKYKFEKIKELEATVDKDTKELTTIFANFIQKQEAEAVSKRNLGSILLQFNYESLNNFVFSDIIKTVKSNLDYLGLTNAGWKFLLKLTPRGVSKVLRHKGNDTNEFIKFINWISHVGIVPRYTLLVSAVEVYEESLMLNLYDNIPFLRAAFIASQKSRNIKRFKSMEFHLVHDWLRNNNIRLDENQKKAPWSWFMRQQAEWHERMLREKKEKIKNQKWDCIIDKQKIDGYDFIPLLNAHELFDEGEQMHHCVGSYASRCMKNTCRIFSIREKDKRSATLEISISANIWSVNQVRSHCNEEVTPEIKKVSEKLVRIYNEAYKKAIEENKVEGLSPKEDYFDDLVGRVQEL